MMKEDWVYRRGDIYFADLDPVVGSEQGGTRPVIVIQNDTGNKHSPTLIVATVTTRIRKKENMPTHLFLSAVPSSILPYAHSARIPSSHPSLQEIGCD